MTACSTPAAAWDAFASAIAARDADAAQRVATAGAWLGHGDSASIVYETAAEEGFRLPASGPAWIEGDRAVLPVRIEAPGRATSLYGLLEQHDGSWSVSAGVRDERHASLFLAGVLPAVFEVTDLGPAPEGEPWARARLEELRGPAAAAGSPAELLGVHALPQRNRVVLGLQHPDSGGRPVQDWVCLDTSEGAARELARSSYPSLGLLLTGIPATLPAREEPVSGAKDKGLDPEEWKVINTFLLGLTKLARSTPPLPDPSGQVPGRVPEVLTEAIARALEGAGQHRDAAALRQKLATPPAGASTGEGAPPTELEIHAPDKLEPVRDELQRVLEAFRKEKGIEPSKAILDAAFLAEHGQELAGRLLRVLANALPLLKPMGEAGPGSGPAPAS